MPNLTLNKALIILLSQSFPDKQLDSSAKDSSTKSSSSSKSRVPLTSIFPKEEEETGKSTGSKKVVEKGDGPRELDIKVKFTTSLHCEGKMQRQRSVNNKGGGENDNNDGITFEVKGADDDNDGGGGGKQSQATKEQQPAGTEKSTTANSNTLVGGLLQLQATKQDKPSSSTIKDEDSEEHSRSS
jgi:hypothetical protein